MPLSAYGFSKLTGEVYCRAAHDEHGLPFTICRPFNAYGPGEVPDAEPGIAHAVPDLIEKVLSGQRPLQIFGSGEQTRTLTHVDDIADGIVTAMGSPAGLNEDFNISASREMTVAEIARVIWEACGEDPEQFELEHLPTFQVDVQRRWPSVEKARELLGWESRISVEDGIADTVRWLRRLRAACGEGVPATAPRRSGKARRRDRRTHTRAPPTAARRSAVGWATADRLRPPCPSAKPSSPASPARTAPTSPSCCSRRATTSTRWCGAPRPRSSSASSTCATA